MVDIIITAIICATIIACIRILQSKGLPHIHIKHEMVQPPAMEALPYQDYDLEEEDPLNPDRTDPHKLKQRTAQDMAALINAFVEGDINIE